eukprot:c25398_g1_i1 orf=846-1679(+)
MGDGFRQRRPYETYEFDDSPELLQRRKKRASSVSSVGRESDAEELAHVAGYCGRKSISVNSFLSVSKELDLQDLGTVTSYCCRETSYPKMFGVLFPSRSFPMDASSFTQIDSTHWVMDMNVFVGEGYDQVKEMCLFLLNEFSLPPDKALAVYVQSPGSEFQYCGAVHRGCPSAVLALLWPNPGGQMQLIAPAAAPLSAKIGLAVEDIISLPAINAGQQHRIEALAMKVGENLFNFMQSFCSIEGNKLVVPIDILNQWFKKFQEKLKRDPDYLKNFVA